MAKGCRERFRTLERALGLIVLAAPLLFLREYFLGRLTIGNDFTLFYYKYKVILLDGLSRGRMPLWSPSEACGFPFYSNPFAQAFYPPNAALVVFYKIAGGWTVLDHQRYTILALSVFAWAMFRWLRSLRVPLLSAFASAVVIGISFKITELVRFPNAAHAAACLPLLLWGSTELLLDRRPWPGFLLTSTAVLCLLTAGYPYFVYYTPFLMCPYVCVLLSRRARLALGIRRRILGSRSRRFLLLCVAVALPMIVCLPYLLKVSQMLKQTAGRVGGDLAYSNLYGFTPVHTLSALVFPPSSRADGWFYFGVVNLLLIVVAWPFRRNRTGTLALLAGMMLIASITYGSLSPVFVLLWHTLPGFSALRAWGRLNIVLLPCLALLLAQAHGAWRGLLRRDDVRARHAERVLLWASGAVLASQVVIWRFAGPDVYWDSFFARNNGTEPTHYGWATAVAAVVLVALLHLGRRVGPRSAWVLTTALLATSWADLRHVGSNQWMLPTSPSSTRATVNFDAVARQSITTARVALSDTVQLGPAFNIGVVPDWYYARYVAFLERATVHGYGAAVARVLGMESGQRLYFSSRIDHAESADFLEDVDAHERIARVRFDVIAYDGDTLEAVVATDEEGHVSFIDNWDPDWTAELDGTRVDIQKLFGTFKSIRVGPGVHRFRFSYAPRVPWPGRA